MKIIYIALALAAIMMATTRAEARTPQLSCIGEISHPNFPAEVSLIGNYTSGSQPILFSYGSTNPWNVGTDAAGYIFSNELHLYYNHQDIVVGTLQREGFAIEIQITRSVGIVPRGKILLKCATSSL